MNKKNCWIIVVVLLAICASCNKKEVLDPEKDYILIRAIESGRNQSDKGIDIEGLDSCALVYEKNKEWGKLCMCDALIGYKLFAARDYDRSLIHLKKAEKNLQYCDSISSFVYTLIVKNTMTTDTMLALNYAQKALEKDLEHNNLRRLPYSYLDLSLLTKGDSAQYYLQKSLDLFNENKKIMAKAQLGRFHSSELDADTVIKYVKLYYETINYVGYARTLIDAYIRKDMPDSTKQYLQHLASRKDFENDYFYCNAEVLTSQGKYEEGCKWWKQAYNRNEEEWQFMINQRLGAINAEYDLLNVEMERKKEKLRLMRIYNSVLMVVMVVMVVAFVAISRYRKNINALEKEVVQRKERFSTLFEEYRKGYELHRETIFADANMNLEALQADYPSLTRTDMAMIWLMFMNCDKETICSMLNISSRYYYNRKSIVQRTLDIKVKDAKLINREIVKIVRKYICKNSKR